MRRARLRIRSLLTVVVLIAVIAYWLVDQPKRRGEAIATTKQLGGFVQFDQEHNPASPVPLPSPSRLVTLSDSWLGPEFAHNLSVVSLDGQAVSDAALANLDRIARLRRLYLNGTTITDAAMAHLSSLSGLEILELRNKDR